MNNNKHDHALFKLFKQKRNFAAVGEKKRNGKRSN